MMINRYITLGMLIISSLFASTSMAAADLKVTADRTWGLFLGDEVKVSVDVSSLEQAIDQSSLPALNKRYGAWLYLTAIDADAKQLTFHYQVVNVPTKNTAIETPKFDVKQVGDTWLVIPTMKITIGPSLAVDGGINNLVAKSDIRPLLISKDQPELQLKLSLITALVVGLILVIWHFGWKVKHRQPFAQAVHDLSRLRFKTVTSDQAARILHKAFNDTSATTMVYGKLDKLMTQSTWLVPLRDDIESFYQQSESHFFARKSEQGPDIDVIRKLAKACRAKEMLA